MPKSLKVKLNSSGFLYTIVTAPTSSLMHSFPFFFCLVCPLTQCNILVSVKWSLFSSVYYYPTLDSILHYRSYSCAVKFSLYLERYLLVMHNNRVTSFHPPYLESYGLHYPFFSVIFTWWTQDTCVICNTVWSPIFTFELGFMHLLLNLHFTYSLLILKPKTMCFQIYLPISNFPLHLLLIDSPIRTILSLKQKHRCLNSWTCTVSTSKSQ